MPASEAHALGDLHVPAVRLVGVHGAFGRQHVEGRDLQPLEAVDGPVVAPVGVLVACGHLGALLEAVEQGGEPGSLAAAWRSAAVASLSPVRAAAPTVS